VLITPSGVVSEASRRKEKEINRDETPAQAANLQDQQDLVSAQREQEKRKEINRAQTRASRRIKKRDLQRE